jgi:hypothetical protein
MLDKEAIKQIEEFVYKQPRSIQEIANHINKNWRTVDRYVQEIKENFGTINTRTFRKGTRGALKIVYWAGVEKIKGSVFQERLEQQIMQASGREDFAAFDIFQHVPKENKTAWKRIGEKEDRLGKLSIFTDLLNTTKKQILFFSGNLSFINYSYNNIDVFKTLEELVKKGIQIKVICRVDITGLDNIKKLLSLNDKYGKELIQIRHIEQPLRVTIIDDRHVNIKEIKEPTGRLKELNKKTFIFYDITDKDWINWFKKIFWNMFNSSIDANKRLEELKKIK